MDEEEFNRTVNIFKEIINNPDRQILPNTKEFCNFRAEKDKIFYDPCIVHYLNYEQILLVLLHEEGHLRNPPVEIEARRNKRGLWIFLPIIIAFCVSIGLVCFQVFRELPIAYLVLFGCGMWCSVEYYHKSHPEPYWDTEYRADEFAVKTLTEVNPTVIWYQVQKAYFELSKKCRNCRKESFSNYIFRKYEEFIGFDSHPPDNERVERVKQIYEEIKKEIIERGTQRKRHDLSHEVTTTLQNPLPDFFIS
ncbi:hypothetical protein [Methanoregula sp.]|uniref:hypothetical protein n=1 Tax=Methanoregula sp. TaxID=2052170 RepID=UPI002D0DF98C|nr:hypothetical protein [Methanoregula sp.]HVP96619.1 hypothetical protein [Methanoregula sp.]